MKEQSLIAIIIRYGKLKERYALAAQQRHDELAESLYLRADKMFQVIFRKVRHLQNTELNLTIITDEIIDILTKPK